MRLLSATLGWASIGFSPCFNFCSTPAVSIARGNSFECLSGCSRCRITLSRLADAILLAASLSLSSRPLIFAGTMAASVSNTFAMISPANSLGLVRLFSGNL